MKKAGDILSQLFKEKYGIDLSEKIPSRPGIFSSWELVIKEVWPAVLQKNKNTNESESAHEEIPAVASHSKIRELEKGVLLIEADHPGWIQILQTKQAELLSAYQRKYPEEDIKSITFRLSKKPV